MNHSEMGTQEGYTWKVMSTYKVHVPAEILSTIPSPNQEPLPQEPLFIDKPVLPSSDRWK